MSVPLPDPRGFGLDEQIVQSVAAAPWWAWPASALTLFLAVVGALWWGLASTRTALRRRRATLEARATGDQDRLRRIKELRQQITMDRLIAIQFVIAMSFSAYGMATVARVHADVPVPANWLLFAVFEGFALVIMTLINQRAEQGIPAMGLRAGYWAVIGLAAALNATHSDTWAGRVVYASITLLAGCSYELRMSAKRANRERELREAAGTWTNRRLALVRWLHPVERVRVALELARDETLSAEEATRIVREQAERARRERLLREVTRAEWRLRRAQLAHRPWGFGWLVDLVERRREARAQEAIFRAGLADSPETVAEVLRTLQVMTLAPRFAGMDYSSTAEARRAMAGLITLERLQPLELGSGPVQDVEPDRVGPDRVELVDRAEPDRTGSDRGEAEHTESEEQPEPADRTEPDQPEPDRTESNRAEPDRTESNRVEPNRVESNPLPAPTPISTHRSMEQLREELRAAVESGRITANVVDWFCRELRIGKKRGRQLRDWANEVGLFDPDKQAQQETAR